ncbi:hypothetical protein ALSL_2392 [Aerosticca soli]|uniref:Uncharacterized protein n=1 Tax=Aerosticca soli TaxID=2010829 RepID=A0A2Z6E7J9_9GAMM|nr:hypothetical protein ALSL_2392 [Aerosticca soli]
MREAHASSPARTDADGCLNFGLILYWPVLKAFRITSI